MYLNSSQVKELTLLLRTFFCLPYSTDLDGKDAETLMRIVKGAQETRSKRKELFDIVDGHIGYSVKTLFKSPEAKRVDLQEQRFCDVDEMKKLVPGKGSDEAQGRVLLGYMRKRIKEHMDLRGIKTAKSIILLKHWDTDRLSFNFKYWEEDFLAYIDELWKLNEAGNIEWAILPAGIHARDRRKQDDRGKNLRLLRMHQKHNQIFTDHDIPDNAVKISFKTKPLTWADLVKIIE